MKRYDIDCTFFDGKEGARINGEHRINGRVIPDGFIWNGASIPLVVTSIVFVNRYHPDVRVPSLPHDYDYDTGEVDRLQSDRDFRDGWLERMPRRCNCTLWKRTKNSLHRLTHWVRGWVMYLTLRCVGWLNYNKKG